MIKLRDYQNDIIAELRQSLRHGDHAPLVVSPTGSGKTVMFATIARGAAAKQSRVYILVHRREILEQTLRSLYQLGITAGQIVAGRPMTREPVQVAMVSTLINRLDYVRRPDLIIVDEAHHALQTNTWGRILKYWGEVPRLGFTATPERLDGRGLGESFDSMIEGPTIADLVELEWLSTPVIYRPPHEVIESYHVKRGDFDRKEQATAMKRRQVVGDVIEHYRKHLDGLPTVCFCVSVEHAKLMAEQFRQAGYIASPVWGNMKREERDRAIQGLGDGSVQVVTSCDVISEGVDVPVMAGAILLRRTMSLGLYLQQAGRALRPFPGKRRAVILDHVGNYYLHGHILEDREWSLASGKRDPRKQDSPTTTTCPRCYGVFPGQPHYCPSCGYSFIAAERERKAATFEQIEGELVEALPGVPDDERRSMAGFLARISRMEPQKKQKALWGKAFELASHGDEGKRRLDALREAVGYSKGWTNLVWKKVEKRRVH